MCEVDNIVNMPNKTSDMVAYRKKWYQDHPDYWMQKLTCECGSVVIRSAMPKHKKTKTHRLFIAEKQINDIKKLI